MSFICPFPPHLLFHSSFLTSTDSVSPLFSPIVFPLCLSSSTSKLASRTARKVGFRFPTGCLFTPANLPLYKVQICPALEYCTHTRWDFIYFESASWSGSRKEHPAARRVFTSIFGVTGSSSGRCFAIPFLPLLIWISSFGKCLSRHLFPELFSIFSPHHHHHRTVLSSKAGFTNRCLCPRVTSFKKMGENPR